MSPDHSTEFVNESVDPPIRGFLHTSDTPTGDVLILSHGAGGNVQAPLLHALADVFSNAGVTVLRCNLPYRQLRPFGPPGPGDAARDRAGLKNAVAGMREDAGMNEGTGINRGAPLLASVARSGDLSTAGNKPRIYLAGHSYGGRQSSMLCAEEPDLVAGLLLLSYPLHPPRKPDQQRTQHLPDLRTPTLFVQGTRDPFASIPELQQALKMIPAKTRLLPVEGAGHDLGFKGKATRGELPQMILSEFQKLFGR